MRKLTGDVASLRGTSEYVITVTEREQSSPLGAQLPWGIRFASGAHNRGAIVAALSTSSSSRGPHSLRVRVEVGDALLRVQRAGGDREGALDESVEDADFYGDLASKLASEYGASPTRPLHFTFRCAQRCEGETQTLEYVGLPTELALVALDAPGGSSSSSSVLPNELYLIRSPADFGRRSIELDPPLRLLSINGRRVEGAVRRAQSAFERACGGGRRAVQLRFEVPPEARVRALRGRVAAAVAQSDRLRGGDDGEVADAEDSDDGALQSSEETEEEEDALDDAELDAEEAALARDAAAAAALALEEDQAMLDGVGAAGGDDAGLGTVERFDFGKRVLFGSFDRSGLELGIEYHIHATAGHHAGWREFETFHNHERDVGYEAPQRDAPARLVVRHQSAPPNPWASLGLRPGDRLIAIDGVPINGTGTGPLATAAAVHARLLEPRSTMLEFEHFRPGPCPLEVTVETAVGIPTDACPLVPLDPLVGSGGSGGGSAYPALKPVAEVRAVVELSWEEGGGGRNEEAHQTLASGATFLDDTRAAWGATECAPLTFATPGSGAGAGEHSEASTSSYALLVKLAVQPPGFRVEPTVDAVAMAAEEEALREVVNRSYSRALVVEGGDDAALHPASTMLRCAALNGSEQVAHVRVRRCDTERVHVSWSGGRGVEGTGLEFVNMMQRTTTCAASGSSSDAPPVGSSPPSSSSSSPDPTNVIVVGDWERADSVRNQWHSVGLERGSVLIRYAWREHGASVWHTVPTAELQLHHAIRHRLDLASSNCEVEMIFRRKQFDDAMRAHTSIAHLVGRVRRLEALLREQPRNVAALITSVKELAEGEKRPATAVSMRDAPPSLPPPTATLTQSLKSASEHVLMALTETARVENWSRSTVLALRPVGSPTMGGTLPLLPDVEEIEAVIAVAEAAFIRYAMELRAQLTEHLSHVAQGSSAVDMHLRQSTAELQRRIVAIGGLRETLTMQCELKAKREALEAAGDELAREVESKMGDVVREWAAHVARVASATSIGASSPPPPPPTRVAWGRSARRSGGEGGGALSAEEDATFAAAHGEVKQMVKHPEVADAYFERTFAATNASLIELHREITVMERHHIEAM